MVRIGKKWSNHVSDLVGDIVTISAPQNDSQTSKWWYINTRHGEVAIYEKGLESLEEEFNSWKSNLKFGLIRELKGSEYYKNDELLKQFNLEKTINKINKTYMSKITTFVKNSFLSVDEKLLIKYGLKYECGDYTTEAKELIISKLTADNNAYLVEQATALEAEEKNNK